MKYFDEQLRNLQEQVFKQKQLHTRLESLYLQKNELDEKEQSLANKKTTEQMDVDQLEGRSLAAFFYGVIGKKDEKLDIERQEAYAAAVKYDAVAKELSALKDDIQRVEAELHTLFGCEERYTETLAQKAEILKSSSGDITDVILKSEEKIAYMERQKEEIKEAMLAGNSALSIADTIFSSLNSAESWGTLDLFGGGVITDIVKHNHLDKAQKMVEQLQVELRRFKTELADITIDTDIQVQIDGFLFFADYFFDGLFADWAVLNRIKQSQNQVQNTRDQIQTVLDRLEDMHDVVSKEQQEQKKVLDTQILHAKI